MAHSIYRPEEVFDHGTVCANRLHEQYVEIIERWEAQVRARLPAAADKTHEEVIDSMPFFLHGLIEALSHDGEDLETGEAAHVFRKHGEQRSRLDGYSLNQIHTEYSILRELLFALLDTEECQLSKAQRSIINRSVDFGLKESASEFLQCQLAKYRNQLEWLETEHEHDRHMLASIQDPFLAFDFEARFCYVNEAAARLFRKLREDLMAKSLWDIFPPGDHARFFEVCQKALHHRETADLTFSDEHGYAHFKVKAYPSPEGFCLMIFQNEIHSAPDPEQFRKERAPWIRNPEPGPSLSH